MELFCAALPGAAAGELRMPVASCLVPGGHWLAYSTLPSLLMHFSNWPCAARDNSESDSATIIFTRSPRVQ
jgi:hypothetical protein